MAFVASPGMTRPVGYSSVGQTGHDADAIGHDDFIMRLRRYVCGVPELDHSGTPIAAVGTHDSTITHIDGSDSSMTTGTWQVRRLNGTTLRIVEPGPTNHDITVTWGTLIEVNVFGSDAVAPLTFKLDDTGADPLIDTEGWDLVFVANGLPAADAWHREAIDNSIPANDIDFQMVLRGRKVAGVTDPTLVPAADKFFVELVATSDIVLDMFQARTQWVTTVPDYSLPETPPLLDSHVRCPLWTEHGVTGARTMPYYIVATARWCIYVVDVGGNWMGGYFGLCDAFATSVQFPLPFLNGGCARLATSIHSSQDTEVSWAHMSNSPFPEMSNLYLRNINGVFEFIENNFISSGGGPGTNGLVSSNTLSSQVWPWGCPNRMVLEDGSTTTGPNRQAGGSVGMDSAAAEPLRGAVDGSKVFIPTIVVEDIPVAAGGRHHAVGNIPFVFWVNGFGVSSGDVVASGSRDFVMIQNIFRSAEQTFWALELA